jgi:hypothetical protein
MELELAYRSSDIHYAICYILRNNNDKKINIVVGCSLSSLMFAYQNNFNLLYTRTLPPSKIEKNISFEGKEYDCPKISGTSCYYMPFFVGKHFIF